MKIFQIMNGICHWDATRQHPSLASTDGLYAPDIVFVEAPDSVHEGWGYQDGAFVQPTPPDGWLYDGATGTFYPADGVPPSQMKTYEELETELETTNAALDELLLRYLGGVS